MPESFRFADEIGPEKIIEIYDPLTGLRAAVVVDNTACGPAIGGLRMALDVSVEECFRLARAMTFKNAAAGLPHGGAKSVIFADPTMPATAKERLIRSFGRAIAEIEDYIAGPDMGTNETCMAWLKAEIGRSVGLPRVLGGIPLDDIGATGYGLAACADVAQAYCGVKLEGARVAVQGFGAVGRHAALFLAAKGARLVAASDSHGTIENQDGLDIQALIAHKALSGSVATFPHGRSHPADAIVGADCDIWIPAARPDVLTAENIVHLKARLVLQGANIPATPDAERLMAERGILSVPDFIANAGGVICAAVEYRGGTESEAFATIAERITFNTRAVLTTAKEKKLLPRAAAIAVAGERLKEAMSYRRTT